MRNFNSEREGIYGASRERGDNMHNPTGDRGIRYDRSSRLLDVTRPGAEYYHGRSTQPKRQTMDGFQPASLNSARTGKNFCGKGPKDYRRSDERIRELICEKLTDDPQLDASEVEVEVKNGEVILSGAVRDKFQKYRAEDLSESVNGILHIENRIKVNKRQMV